MNWQLDVKLRNIIHLLTIRDWEYYNSIWQTERMRQSNLPQITKQLNREFFFLVWWADLKTLRLFSMSRNWWHTPFFFKKSIAIANIQIDWSFPSLLSSQFLSPAISLPQPLTPSILPLFSPRKGRHPIYILNTWQNAVRRGTFPHIKAGKGSPAGGRGTKNRKSIRKRSTSSLRSSNKTSN